MNPARPFCGWSYSEDLRKMLYHGAYGPTGCVALMGGVEPGGAALTSGVGDLCEAILNFCARFQDQVSL